jgi:GH18 family chitinase
MKRIVLVLLLSAASAARAAPLQFPEVWAYLMKGEEAYFPERAPITDVACFSAQVDSSGRLVGGHPEPPALPGARADTRYHLVVTIPWNATLAGLYLDPDLPLRRRIIDSIVERSGPFDGVQIDFESIDRQDGTRYLNFLVDVKKALAEDKCFSIAVMARWAEHKQKHPDDAFDYPFISMIADRVIVMAYDEHYRGGSPGPIASLPWCEKIYTYARSSIDPAKLVMGIPLYGRGWQTPALARAYKNSEIVEELAQRGIEAEGNPEEGGSCEFTETVTVKVHYETLQSLEAKLHLYRSHPIRGVAFWRISQEPSGFWTAASSP